MLVKDEYPERALAGFWIQTERWEEINEKRIEKIKAESLNKFPSYAYNFKKIRYHWKKLQTYEDAVEYLDRVKGQWEYDKRTFISNLILDIGAGAFFMFPIPPEGGKENKELWYRFFIMITKWLGLDRSYMLYYPWVSENKETGKYHFSDQRVDQFFEAVFNIEKKEIDHNTNKGWLPRRDELETKAQPSTNQTEAATGGKNSLWLKFQCPKNNLKNVGEIFQKFGHENILKIPEDFNISNYFSAQREEKNTQTLGERIDWKPKKDWAGLVAFIEILEEDYEVKTQPSQAWSTFTKCGKKINKGCYNTYKSSKPAPSNDFKKREAVDRRKAELRNIID